MSYLIHNVFIGDMSIVGPRLHMVEHDIKYSNLFDSLRGNVIPD